jgi:hypothetical protein
VLSTGGARGGGGQKNKNSAHQPARPRSFWPRKKSEASGVGGGCLSATRRRRVNRANFTLPILYLQQLVLLLMCLLVVLFCHFRQIVLQPAAVKERNIVPHYSGAAGLFSARLSLSLLVVIPLTLQQVLPRVTSCKHTHTNNEITTYSDMHIATNSIPPRMQTTSKQNKSTHIHSSALAHPPSERAHRPVD